jgi:hypothetical protein
VPAVNGRAGCGDLEEWCDLVERALQEDELALAWDAIKTFPGPLEVEQPNDSEEASRISRLGERVSHLTRLVAKERREAAAGIDAVQMERRQLRTGAAKLAHYVEAGGQMARPQD